MLTLAGGSFLQLLVNSVWRVQKRISEIDAGGQIQHGAKRIQAEISYQSMHDDYTLNYLKIFMLKRCLGKGRKSVVRNEFISSDWWCSFQKNFGKPHILGTRIIDISKFFKMVHHSSRSKFWRLSWTKISKLFCGGNWREIIWGITCEDI